MALWINKHCCCVAHTHTHTHLVLSSRCWLFTHTPGCVHTAARTLLQIHQQLEAQTRPDPSASHHVSRYYGNPTATPPRPNFTSRVRERKTKAQSGWMKSETRSLADGHVSVCLIQFNTGRLKTFLPPLWTNLSRHRTNMQTTEEDLIQASDGPPETHDLHRSGTLGR